MVVRKLGELLLIVGGCISIGSFLTGIGDVIVEGILEHKPLGDVAMITLAALYASLVPVLAGLVLITINGEKND